MNTIAASTRRVPRAALIGIVAVIAAFVALMLVRSGVLGGSSTSSPPAPTRIHAPTPPGAGATRAKPTVVLLPGLPQPVARALRYSKVVVVSLYTAPAPSDRTAVAQARAGARTAGAGFVAVNVVDDKRAAELASFVGPASAPAMLVVKRPGRIVTRMPGTVDSAVVAQAARNAGARRR